MSFRRKSARRALVGDNREGNLFIGQVASKLSLAERSFQITEEEFEKKFKAPLATIYSHVRDLRNYILANADLQENHKDVFEKINNVDQQMWDVHRCSSSFSRRLRIQSQKFKKASVKTCTQEPSPSKKPKSATQMEAGNIKAGSLTLWKQACQDARAALKAAGYNGSVSLKKGGPMYTKAVELLKGRTASASSASTDPAVSS